MARVALSSNTPSALHSILTSLGVRTVKRAFPQVTTASGAAFGSFWAAAEAAHSSNAEKAKINFFIY